MTSAGSGNTTGGEPLTADGVTAGIVRIGDTVRRPVRPFTQTVQAYLAHLHQAGFTAAPVPLGIDEQGREVLSFVPGYTPREPLPADTAGEEVLAALARLIRALHVASAGWAPPPGAVWGGIPGAGAAALPPVDGQPELVSHRDYCPGNVVFRDGLPAALIDFDLAKPTTRLYDIANALWWWAPLCDPRDRAPAFAALDISRRAAVFADAYGMTAGQRRDLVPLTISLARRRHQTARAAAGASAAFQRLWEEGARDKLPRAEAWLEREGPVIAERLTRTAPRP